MIIKNKHGQFELNSSHYNWLMRSYCFQDITAEIVQKTLFINSSWEYEKADKLKKELERKR